MGQFSWLDCKDGKQILDNVAKTAYLLVPEEFKEQFGEKIPTQCYDGYGHFGSYDVYELVALWNRRFLSIENLQNLPKREQYGEEEYYQMAMNRYKNSMNRLEDFRLGTSDEKMKEKYGKDYLREIGIDVACYDEQNAALTYPIKITYDGTAVYEQCDPSPSDPNQGWLAEEEEEMDWDEWRINENEEEKE